MKMNFLRSSMRLCALPLSLAVISPAVATEESASAIGVNWVQQKGRTVKVTVKDAAGEIIGANVIVKGTTIGSITDMSGVAVIQDVPNGAILQVSYVGYTTVDVPLKNNQESIVVTLKEDAEALDEVVVVGYGTQAKKDITGSVAVVSRDDIQVQPVASFAEALQGRAPGVYVNTSGGPSGETTIRIRGVGSMKGSDPLVIVDGVQDVDISSVNPNDIDSFQVLKDAAATAIYGARAANGVIIITTKQGSKSGKVRITYNGYVSASQMANDGYPMMGAWESMEAEQQSQWNLVNYRGYSKDQVTHQQFGSIANGDLQMPYAIVPTGYSKQQIIDEFGSIDNWVNSYNSETGPYYSRSAYYQMLEDGYSEAEAREGTNWFDEVTQTGISHNHELSVTSGNDKGQYAFSMGYTNREGTVKNSAFERYNMRLNTTFTPTEHFIIGQNTNVATMKITGERGRQGDANTFGKTYTTASWVPLYNVSGQFAGSVGGGGRDTSPYSSVINAADDWMRFFRMQSAVFAEIKDPWIKGLSVRTQFAASIRGGWTATMNERTIEYNKEGSSQNNFNETGNWYFDWQWTNTATYKTSFADDHDLTVMIGTEALKRNIGRSISGTRYEYIFEKDPNTWTLDNGGTSNITNSGSMGDKYTMFGYFGRVDYSYQGKYLATFTVRRDASSKFSEKHRWGTFPSASLGWRISDEPFLQTARQSWLDDLKLRLGYGTTGNSNIGSYNYAFQYANENASLYSISGDNSGANTGYAMTNLGDTEAKWETVKMFNVGYDFTAFNNRLTSSFDFYVKNTSDMLVDANWTYLAGGAEKPSVNIGSMRNVGVDFSVGWRGKIGQVSYNVNANASWYRNEVTKLGSSNLYTSTRISELNITTVGQPIAMFYGYQLDGIYKSVDDVMNYKNDNGQTVTPYGTTEESLNPQSWVGHYKFKDLNNDGRVDQDDRTIIGNPHPDLTGGINIGINWRDWDLSTYLYYSIGNDLYAHYQYYTYWGNLSNVYSRDRVQNAWHPETNPNGTLPMWVSGDTAPETTLSHSGYIQDGSFLRMQTLTLGYSLPKSVVSKLNLSRIRVYAQLANVFTLTGYEGLDPEVRSNNGDSSNDMMKGIDYGSYGMPKQYLIGLNVEF